MTTAEASNLQSIIPLLENQSTYARCWMTLELRKRPGGHARGRTQIIPIGVIGAGSEEIGEAVQNGGSLRGYAKTEITVRDRLHRRLCS